ncbi:Acetyltransferase, GNAT family [Beijerinckiaceae bacterium RH AL1]|nr:Acetyltransferase, GNAT family [Beijerinckiaceae bacterium RH CH11]VVB48156.1 Acetyltransferase, GNAT family [Beijerinckiaceae bacterium RH AL8]VVC56212.1 Acetyltransferase, GNAT family [Beijerinckiaceae bacterium RH AL1]
MRPLRAGDVEALAELWVASWQAAMPEIDFAARRDWIVAFVGEPGRVTLVAELGGAPAGFATLEGAYLHQLVVAQARKGRGLATALLDAAKAGARDGLRLDVNAANARAVRFYEREGFRKVGEGVNPASGLPTLAMAWP